MDDGVAVRTNGPQILYGVHLVFLAKHAELAKVVHVDESICDGAVALTEVHATRHAMGTIKRDALGPSLQATRIGVCPNLSDRTFCQRARRVRRVDRWRIEFAKAAGL